MSVDEIVVLNQEIGMGSLEVAWPKGNLAGIFFFSSHDLQNAMYMYVVHTSSA